MSDESDLTASVGPETVSEAPDTGENIEGQAEGQTAPPEADADGEEKKSKAAERREREKAHKERLRQEAKEANERAERAEAQKAKLIKAGESEKPPTEADFPDIVDLAAAKAVWAAKQQTRADQVAVLDEEVGEARKQAEIRDMAERQIIERNWSESLNEARTRYADFDAVALAADVPITPEIAAMIKTSDQPADVAYWLGQNKAVAAQIADLPPIEAARALGRIEAQLSAPKPRTSTTAPEPITPTKAGGTTVRDASKMSYADYVKARANGWTPS